MFLDNEVLEICKKAKLDTPEDVQGFYAEVCNKFDDYRRNNMNAFMTGKEIKSVINKTFNLWNSTVRMCLKSGDHKLIIIGEMLQKYSFKDVFLKDKEMKRIYDIL
jgi:hypothetical protein